MGTIKIDFANETPGNLLRLRVDDTQVLTETVPAQSAHRITCTTATQNDETFVLEFRPAAGFQSVKVTGVASTSFVEGGVTGRRVTFTTLSDVIMNVEAVTSAGAVAGPVTTGDEPAGAPVPLRVVVRHPPAALVGKAIADQPSV